MDDSKKDYKISLERARRRREGRYYRPYLFFGAGAAVLIALILAIAVLTGKKEPDSPASEAAAETFADAGSLREEESRRAMEEQQREEAERQAVVDSYENLGLVHVEGYLNVRKTPEEDGDIIGKMQNNSACRILGQEGEWYHISSGGLDGYISAQYVITGEEARKQALDQVQRRAIVHVSDDESLNIRSSPAIEPDNIVGQALNGERYVAEEELDGWIRIAGGYISSDYADVELALNEARKMDLKAMAVSRYHNLLVSKVTNYLNIRETPADQGNDNIIGKLPGKAAADILETEDGWYKIRSGNITGYVSSSPEYVATGQEATDLALQNASLMAIVNTDRLNVRKEPSTDSGVWTQISKSERYYVLDQLDGWVQIELDTGDEDSEGEGAYISTRDNNVEVRYALEEAIEFHPLQEIANQQAARRAQIVNYALRFVGNRYVWGGTSLTNGCDCSGFTQSVLKNFGIYLPRVSRDQANAGKGVSSSDKRPGDLIFYTNSRGVVNHVAMYIGNGQVVHAASRKSGIRISTWNYRTPYRIRNVID